MKIWLLVSKEETKRRFGRSMYHSFSFLHNQIMWLSFQPYVIWLRPLYIFPQCCLSPSQLHISSLLSGNAMRFCLHNALILVWVNGILSNPFPLHLCVFSPAIGLSLCATMENNGHCNAARV